MKRTFSAGIVHESDWYIAQCLDTDVGIAIDGAFDSDTAAGMMPIAHRVAGVLESRRS